jgi:hypothetical protein
MMELTGKEGLAGPGIKKFATSNNGRVERDSCLFCTLAGSPLTLLLADRVTRLDDLSPFSDFFKYN